MRALVAAAACLIACARGGSATNDSAEPVCGTLVCNMPPANECADADNLIAYDAMGTCDQGTCSYASMMITCPDGCEGKAC